MSTDLCTKAKLILLIFLSLVIAGCQGDNVTSFFQSQTKTTDTAPILNVNCMRVTKVDEAVEISVFFGSLKPNRQSQLRFNQPGRVEKLLKEVGETVQSGEQIASLELDQGSIVAPYDCVVASLNVAVGDSVSPQSPVATVFETQPLLIQANLPMEITRTLQVGDAVWVVVGDDSVKSKVKSLSPVESTPGSRGVSFETTDPIESSSWSFGQSVKIQFLTATENSGFWIPVSALSRESTGLWSALVVTKEALQEKDSTEKSSVERRILELVQLEDDWALTQGALANGELVIVNGSHRVVPGQSVNAKDITAQYEKPSLGAGE